MDLAIIGKGAIVGIIATLVMDIVGAIGVRFGFVRLTPLGRWALYLFKGTFHHKDIKETPAIKGERLTSVGVHYLAGTTLATLYLLGLRWLSLGNGSLALATGYGLATSLISLLLLFPSMGYGLFGLGESSDIFLLRQSLVNHVAYGVGIWLAMKMT